MTESRMLRYLLRLRRDADREDILASWQSMNAGSSLRATLRQLAGVPVGWPLPADGSELDGGETLIIEVSAAPFSDRQSVEEFIALHNAHCEHVWRGFVPMLPGDERLCGRWEPDPFELGWLTDEHGVGE